MPEVIKCNVCGNYEEEELMQICIFCGKYLCPDCQYTVSTNDDTSCIDCKEHPQRKMMDENSFTQSN